MNKNNDIKFFYTADEYSKNKEEIKSSNKRVIVKDKFFTRTDPSIDVPGFNKYLPKKENLIQNESNLIAPSLNSKDKTQLKLNDEFHPGNYDLSYSNNIRKFQNQKTGFYYGNRDVGAGRGFGNLNISNDIRYGDQGRKDSKEFKEIKESETLFDYQFQYLDRNFQDPNHIVMPIPRGGEMTRKQNQLQVNTIRSNNPFTDFEEITKTIKFDY